MADIVVMSRALEKSARAILSGTARVIGDEAERHSSTRQPHRHHRQVCPHQRQRTSSPLRRKPAARFGDHVSDARMAPLPNPCGKKLTGDGNVEQPAGNAAARRKPSGQSAFFRAKPGGLRRSATWTTEPAEGCRIRAVRPGQGYRIVMASLFSGVGRSTVELPRADRLEAGLW